MKFRASLAVGVLAASSVAFGVVGLGSVDSAASGTIDAHKQASDVIDTTSLGTIESDFETTRANGMQPVVAVETGPTTDVQLQRRTVEREVDGEIVEETLDLAVVGLSGLSGPHGLELLDVTDPTAPVSLSKLECGGFHNDVAVWQDYVALGFDGGAAPCPSAVDALGPAAIPSGSAVYLFDISDLENPTPVAVYSGVDETEILELTTGTHNLGIHPDGFLYFATAGFDALEPDLGIVDLNDLESGATMLQLRGISPLATDGCHDLGFNFQGETPQMVCPAIESTFIWDLSDPMAPTEIATIANPAITIHHGGRFTPDGSTVVLGDELAGAAAPSGCLAGLPVGAMWTYDLTVPQAPIPTGYVSASESPSGTLETCTSHFYNFVPNSEDRTLSMTGWYGGGMVMHDLTPIVEAPLAGGGLIGAGPEVAHLEPTGAEMWAAYAWYGNVYGGSYTGNTGLFIASLDGYSDTADAELQPYCNDVGIVWGPSTDDWESECRNPGDPIPGEGDDGEEAGDELPSQANDRAREARSRRGNG